MLLIIIIILGVLIVIGLAQNRKKCKEQYLAAKDALRQDPSNGALREAMLESGRKYYASLRNGGRLTIYDEQALTNDLMSIVGSDPRC